MDDRPGRIEWSLSRIGMTPGTAALPTDGAPHSDGERQGAAAGVDTVVRSPGEALDGRSRQMMESRFGHDFGDVRVHADTQASDSAQAVGAAAYTTRNHVVFGRGRYQPRAPAGRHLLAHELAHVVQQRGAHGSPPVVQRLGFFESVGVFLGLVEGDFSEKELSAYLKKVTDDKKIEDSYDSDNKARAIVRRWKAGDAKFDLWPAQKVLLIREMLSGPTLGEDEKHIMDLLELSDNIDLRRMFGSDGVRLADLESDLQGESKKRLASFVAMRFEGGREAVMKGSIELKGKAAKGAPVFAYDWATLQAKIEGDYTVEEIVETISRLDGASRDKALGDVGRARTAKQREFDKRYEDYRKETDAAKKDAMKPEIRAILEARNKLDQILQPIFKDIAIAETPASLKANTTEPDAAQKTEIAKALKPDVKKAKGGKPKTFVETLPGETKTYEEKMREHMPTMIQKYYDSTVKGRGKAEHDDSTKVHSLKEMEDLGNVSKDETDKVFGQYKKGPALKADTKKRRGNIHDLFADTEKDLKGMSFGQRRRMARQLLFYFFQSDDFVRNLNRAHSASPDFDNNNRPRNDEAKSLAKLAKEFAKTGKQVKRLNEIDRGWDASAGGGHINIQIFKGETVEADRDFLWDMFQTLVHEYLHTLVHADYDAYAETFGDNSNQYNTLIEGVDSLFTETVWSNVEPRVNDPALRKKIEGPTYAKLPPMKVKPASRRRYPSYTEAVKLTNIVGIRNVYAAYFLGDIKKIGG